MKESSTPIRSRSLRPLFSVITITVIASTLLALIFRPQGSVQAAPILTITPLTWNVVGLDSNNVNAGPNNFPVGARVCNTGDTAAANVVSSFVWDSSAAYIALRPGSLSTHSLPSLAAGSCTDFYYEVEITRNSAAYDTTRRYHITAAADTLGTISTPVPREIYVEHLVSQNRNAVTDVILDGDSIPAGGTMSLLVGNTYTIQLVGSTATNGYEQIESFINFPNTIFVVNSVATTYSANAGTDPNSATKPYADGCSWINNPASPNYRACTGTGKYGGDITVTYNVTIIGGGGTSQTLNTLIYDFSGSSYHYNADFSTGARIASIVDPAASLTIDKAFLPSSTTAGGSSTLTFLISNSTSSTISGVNFTDDLPTSPGAMTVAAAPNASTSGCGTPTFAPAAGAATLSFSDGTLAPNSTCVVSVAVSVPASPTTGTYSNTSDNLFINLLDTGDNASADLTLTTTTPGTGLCSQTLAQWNFPTGSSNTAPAPSTANVAASALAGSGLTALFSSSQDNTTSPTGTGSWSSNGDITTGALDTANNEYFEFAIDTTGYSAVYLRFDARRTNNGPRDLHVYSGTSAAPPGNGAYNFVNSLTAAATWFSFGASDSIAFSSELNPAGTTYFRIFAAASNNSVPGSDIFLDNVTFTGCAIADHPTLSKSFLADPIAVNAASTLRFTLTNPNSYPLTGVEFTDSLPAGLEVAAAPAASTTCSGSPTWSPAAGSTTLTFGDPAGATIPAGSSCLVNVNVTATTSGPHTNVSGFISSTESGTNSGPDGSATDTLTALLPPVISKLFSPNPILAGGTSTLTFTLLNQNLNDSLSGVAFSDTFPVSPGAMTVASPAGASTSGCGSPLFSPSPGAGSIAFSGGTLAPGGECTVTVNVTASTVGAYSNTSGAVSTVINGVTVNGNSADDSLTVNAPNPGVDLLKQISTTASGPWSQFLTVTPGTDVYYRFTIENTGDVPLSPVSVTDATVSTAGCSWPASLPVADASDEDHVATCVVGPVTALAGANPNTAVSHGTYSSTVYDSDPSSAQYLGASAGFSLLKQVGVSASGPWTSALSGVPPGSDVYYRFTIINTGALDLTSINVTDPDVSTASCSFTDPLVVGDATACVVGPVTAPLAAGAYPNTATAHGTNSATVYDSAPSTATYTVSLTPPDLTITKANDAGGTVTLSTPFTWTLQVDNGAGAGEAAFADGQVILSDPLPAGAVYGSPAAGSFVNITNSANILCAITSGVLRCSASGASVTLGAGGSFSVSLTVTPSTPGDLVNTAAVDPLGIVNESDETNNTGSDTVTVTASTPEVDLVKTGTLNDDDGTPGLSAGDTISYAFAVENTGAVTLSNITLTDTVGGVTILGGPIASLAPGATDTTTFTGAYTITQPDIDAGSFDNTADVSADCPGPVTACAADSDDETVTLTGTPAIQLTKTGTLNDDDGTPGLSAGDTISYAFAVENTGAVTLSNITLADTVGGVTILGGPIASLAPGATDSTTFTGAYTVTQTDINAGSFDNTATVNADCPGPAAGCAANADSETVPLTGTPALQLTKTGTLNDDDGTPGLSAGDTISYAFIVENTGTITLSNLTLVDTVGGVAISGGPIASLAPGATDSTTFTGSYTLLQTDIDAGSFDNTASVSGDCPGPVADCATDSDDETVTLTGAPALLLTKTGTLNDDDGTPGLSAGDTISYAFSVENTGNLTLSNIALTDTVGGVTILGGPIASLAPAATDNTTFTGTYTVTQTDIDAGTFNNTASVSGDCPGPVADCASDSDDESVTLTGAPSMQLTKTGTLNDDDGTPGLSAGDTISYAFSVENTGTITLSNITLTDTVGSVTILGGPLASLAPGATDSTTFTGSYTLLQTDIDAGSFDNTASVSGDCPGPIAACATDSDDETVNLSGAPSMQLTKTGTLNDDDGTTGLSAGDTISYAFTVENTGTITLSNITLTDTVGGVTILGGPLASLAPGATDTTTYTGSYTVTQTDIDAGSFDNSASVSGDCPGPVADCATDSDDETVTLTGAPSMQLTKTGTLNDDDGTTGLSAGDTISYAFSVENTGNVTLSNITLTDTVGGVTILGGPLASLAPGATDSTTFTGSYTVTQTDIDAGSFDNTASVSGDCPGPVADCASDSDDESVTLTGAPALGLTKSADPLTYDTAGQVIDYTYVVENTGNVTLTGPFSVSDDVTSDESCPATASLAPGAAITCTSSYTILQADLESGSVTNTAFAAGSYNSAPVQSPDDSATVTAVQTPLIGVAKRLTGVNETGTGTYEVTFEMVVRNYGNVLLTAVQVTDDLAAAFPPPTTFTVQSLTSPDLAVNGAYNGGSDINLLAGTDTLDPGEDGTLTLVVQVVPAGAGPFNNSAFASGTGPGSTLVTDESQDGTDPDEDNNGDPTNDTEPTPVDFGPNIFDPPFGLKVFDDNGLPMLRWTMTWINDSNIVAVDASVSDPIPAGTTYSAAGSSSGYPVPGGAPAGSTEVGVTCEADPASLITTTSLCYYEGPTVTYPRGRIIWQGTLGPDPGATGAGNAAHEIVIRFNVVVDTGITSVSNTATMDSDRNGDNDLTDPGEQIVASAAAQWTLAIDPGVTRLPDTGFAPGRITLLPAQPDPLAYSATDLVLEIPSQTKKIAIVGVPYTARGWDVTWLGTQAGYLDGTAFPTWAGNSVITGHVYLPNGLPGPFVDLGALRYGDRLIVHFAGQRYVYQVRENKVVSPSDDSVFQHEEYSWLTLVTCRDFNESTGTYARRVVVRAVLIKVEPDSESPGGR